MQNDASIIEEQRVKIQALYDRIDSDARKIAVLEEQIKTIEKSEKRIITAFLTNALVEVENG